MDTLKESYYTRVLPSFFFSRIWQFFYYFFWQEIQNGSSIEDRSPIESTVENSPLAAEEASSTDEGLVNQNVRFNWKYDLIDVNYH